MIGFWIVLVSVFSNLCFLFDEILQMFKNQNDKKIHMNFCAAFVCQYSYCDNVLLNSNNIQFINL